MLFTAKMFGGSIALMLLAHYLLGDGIVTTIGALWFIASFPLVGYYWIARVVRRAWRDGSRAGDAGA